MYLAGAAGARNWPGAPRCGFSGLYISAQGRALAQPIGDAFARRGLPRKADVRRDGLFFLNQTVMPALIPEINRVHNYGDRVNQAQREALAESTCAFLGRTYQPPGHPAPDPHVHTAQPGVVTPDSPLRGPTLVPATQAEQYLLARPHGSYSAGDVARIGDLYYTTAGAVGLDALLVSGRWPKRPHTSPRSGRSARGATSPASG